MLKKLLGFDPQTMALRTEIIAGITTFLTMSYILAVNPSILATTGMDKGAVFTATALASALATLLLAFMAKLPFAQAPSMALNAFFAFTLVQGMGYSWQTAMTAMFVEGVIFILITFLNVREVILNSIPMNLRFAISAGIGMFIAFVGLKNAGIIVPNPATFVMFGPFTPVSVLAMVGILLSGILVLRKVKGVLFLLALFFAPLFLLIPSAATTGALVLVGVFMMDSITKVDMDDISEALPAFITMIMMVLTYSIADGMVLGLLCYVLVKLGCGKHKEVSPTMYVLAALFILKFIFA